MKNIGGLSNNIFRSMSTKLYQRVVHNIFRSMSIKLYFEGLSNIYIFDIWRMSNELHKQKSFVLKKKTDFINGKCMCERVGEDSRHGHGM